MRSLLALLCLGLIASVTCFATDVDAQIVINEIRTDQDGTDDDEFFELAGPPGTALDGLTYVVIGDGGAPVASGAVEAAVPLDGLSIPASGYFFAAEASFTLGTPDLEISLAFENDDNVTHLLVDGFTGAVGDDLDTDDDGTLDVTPWTGIIDIIALVEFDNPPPTNEEWHYGPPSVGPALFPQPAPGYVRRCPDTTGDFVIGGFDPVVGDDTPGASNGTTCPLCFDISGLTCTSDCASGDVTLTWTNSTTPYTEIEISRDGTFLASVPGTDTSFVDTGVVAGGYTYSVVGICDVSGVPTPSTPLDCAVLHSPYNGETHIIFVGEGSFGDVDSAQALADAFTAVGESFILTDQIDAYACFGTFGPGNVIWLMLGTTPADYELTDGDAAVLTGLVDNGVACYLESADHFAWAPLTTFHDYDGVDASVNMPGTVGWAPDGDDTLTLLAGSSFGGLDLSGFQDVVYFQDRQGGSDFTDQLVPAATDALGTTTGVIWSNVPDMLPDPMVTEVVYDVGVFYATDGAAGNVISTSFEFGGFQDDQVDLMINYLNALTTAPVFESDCGNGVDDDGDGMIDCADSDCASDPICIGGDQFIRGDSNADGTVNVADAVFAANSLFVMGSPPPDCLDAADCNDDGTFNIADVVYTANFLFTAGSPAPPSPFPGCGVDPSSDPLDCAAYVCP